MDSIDLLSCEMGTISSRVDGAVTMRITTAELRPSEAGLLMQYHGKACRVAIFPHQGDADSHIEVKTERGEKTQAQRIRSCIFKIWQAKGSEGSFDFFYHQKTERIIDALKKQIEE